MSDLVNINEDAQSGGEYSGSQSSNNNDDENHKSQPSDSAFPDEDEETITMLDVIEREDKLEEEASAVLGYSDEKNCTYPRGYIPRQALYSCKTCYSGPDSYAAICLACSLECHENHEVYELYTKRNYRCDCGNSKFSPDFECKLMDKDQKKLPINEKNTYNHNFSGRYCTCNKRYPPEENDNSADSNDEMWQCINCEDWYHSKHVGVKDTPTRFEELICGTCVEKLDFVHYYRDCEKPSDDEHNSEDITGDDTCNQPSTSVPTTTGEEPRSNSSSAFASSGIGTGTERLMKNVKQNICESDTNDSQEENKDPGSSTDVSDLHAPEVSTICALEGLKRKFDESSKHCNPGDTMGKGPIFWSNCVWRSKLCRCHKCMEMYKAKDCEYLLDEKDTVQYYEAQGKAIAKNSESPYERGMSALNKMNRAAVVEALHGYDEMKADLSSYLKTFAESKKVVREQDIHEFFQQLKSKKKPRFDQS